MSEAQARCLIRARKKVPRPFRAVQVQHADTPGVWRRATIRILQGDTEIGSYERNYGSFGARTFEPFEMDGRWYALYSRDYTATRIMSLPDCRDIGGEEQASNGFCPVEFFAPRYRVVPQQWGTETVNVWYFEASADAPEPVDVSEAAGWRSLDLAFVAGCIWGDDGTWKLQTIDLREAVKGRIVRDARFGHLEIAGDLPLATAVQLSRYEPRSLRATIFRQEDRDIATGKRIDPYDDDVLLEG